MSSARKDARWYLASVMVEAAGVDSLNKLPYPQAEALLGEADKLLAFVGMKKTQELADIWNSPPVEQPEPELEWGIKNFFTNRVGFPFPEAQARSIVAGTYNSEDGSNMFVVVKRRPATEWEDA